MFHFILGLLFLLSCSACTPPPPAAARLVPCAPLPVAHPSEATLRNYTYTKGELIFNPQNIRLGSSSTTGTQHPFPRTNKGVQLHISLNHQQEQWSNENILKFPLPDGEHQLYAFLIGSYFESIKVPEAVFAKNITVRNGQLAKSMNLLRPTVLYNMPLGQHRLRANDSLLVDFVLANTTIAPNGNRVRLQLDEQTPWDVDQWQPYALAGLSAGKHRLSLTLINAQGTAIAPVVSKEFVVLFEEG